MGVIKQTVSSWENGISEPNSEVLLNMASIFDVSVDYLLGKSDKPSREQEEPFYTNEKERNLLEVYRDYDDNGFSYLIAEKIEYFFPEIKKYQELSVFEKQLIDSFKELSEDNQYIIMGKTKELLREQKLESVAADNLLKNTGTENLGN